MVDVEELMSKIKSGVWSTQDAFDCIKDLEQEYLQSSKTKKWREDYSLAAYFTARYLCLQLPASVYFL